MRFQDWWVPSAAALAILGSMAVIAFFSVHHYERLQAECEAKGGVLFTVRESSLCLNPKDVID